MTKSKTPPALSFNPTNLFIQYEFVEMFVNHLADSSKAFGGDLVELMVLAIIGQVQIRELFKTGLPMDFRSIKSQGISSSRIADVTGIPRQTVRRKLLSMEGKGWIYKGEDHRWRLVVEDGVAVANTALSGLFEKGVERARQMAAHLKPFV